MFNRIKKTYGLDYYWFWTPENWTWGGNTASELDATKNDLSAAMKAAESVDVPFTLATCGWVLGPQNDRAMFDSILPKTMPMSCINRRVGWSPVDPAFEKIRNRPKWAIPWLEDDPNLIIPQLWAGRMRADAADALNYGCTGLIGYSLANPYSRPEYIRACQSCMESRTVRRKTVCAGSRGGNYFNL